MAFENSVRNKYLSCVLFDSLDDGNLKNVEFLLAVKRANPNIYLEEFDVCPIHCAVGAGTEEFAYKATSLCLKFGGDPNVRNSDGNTPVHIAAWWGRRKVADILLAYGGDPFLKDEDGSNALDLALENHQEHLYSRFIHHQWIPTKLVEREEEEEDFHTADSSEHLFVDKMPPNYQFIISHDVTSQDNNSNDFITLDSFSYTDIESELNYIEIFTPAKEVLEFNSVDAVSSLKHSSRDVSNLLRLRCNKKNMTKLVKANSVQSLASTASAGSVKSWATEYVCSELKRFNIFDGPVVKSTKRLYIRQLKKFKKDPENVRIKKSNEEGFNEIISATFGPRLLELITKWSPLLDDLTQCCNYHGRGNKERCYFTYILLDPLVTNNLPNSMVNLEHWEIWKIFISAVFYIGKGKNSRPMAHLYDALKTPGNQVSKKIDRIKHIWSAGYGVVCVQAFHNLTEMEAYNREAAMIDALHDYQKLTNQKAGDYSGKIKGWPMKEKRRLGVLLLHRAMQIYIADHERQIHPRDLKPHYK